MATAKQIGILSLCFFGVLECFINQSGKQVFTNIAQLDENLFIDRKLFTASVDSYHDCTLLCFSETDCLSFVYIAEDIGMDICVGYNVVFQDDLNAIYYLNAKYYAMTRSECQTPYYLSSMANTSICLRLFLDPVSDKLDGLSARDKCLNDGGWLVRLDTKEKHMALSTYLGLNSGSLAGNNSGLYVGGYRDTDVWMWEPNVPFSYTNWTNGEPTNNTHKTCMKVNEQVPFEWSSANCTVQRYFICERPVF